MIDPALTYVLMFGCLLTGLTGGWLLRGNRKRQMPPNGSALRHSQPVWAEWSAEIGKAIAGRKE